MVDNIGNEYKRVGFSLGEHVEGQSDDDSIYPGKALTDVLVFEVPVEGL